MFISWIGCIWNIWKSYNHNSTSHSKTQKSSWRTCTESGLWLKWFRDIQTFAPIVHGLIGLDLRFREALQAFADLVYSLGLPMLATELFLQRHWIFGSVPCKLVSTVLLLNLYGSVYFLSTISLGKLLTNIINDSRKFLSDWTHLNRFSSTFTGFNRF